MQNVFKAVFYFKTITARAICFQNKCEAMMVIRFAGTPSKAEPVIQKSRTTEHHPKDPAPKADEHPAEPISPPPKKGRGRPSSGKETVTLRLDARTVAFFKTYGEDWREAMSDALDKAAFR